jgi:hypothetical protein
MCQLSSSSEKYQLSSSALPSKLGAECSPLPGKSANGILCTGGGFMSGAGAMGSMGTGLWNNQWIHAG